jgi:hypothetical protein
MAQTVIITLTTAGADTGPFDLYSNIDGFAVPFESNVAKGDLEAGYVSFLVPDAATTIRVQSDNPLCDNFIDLIIPTTTTTSTTGVPTTTTTTTAPSTTTTTTSEFIEESLIQIGANISIDIEVNSVQVNSVPAVYDSGDTLPNGPGNLTILVTEELGTHTVAVNYTATLTTQSIELTDSASNVQCQNVNAGTNDMFFPGVIIDGITNIVIVPKDGAC